METKIKKISELSKLLSVKNRMSSFLSLSRPSSFCPAGCQLDLMKSLGKIPNWA